jgi:hypothetical protein
LTAVATGDHQGRPFELVELGDEVGCFPGVPDQDGVDRAMAGWAMSHDQVLAVTRCWAQPPDDDTQRIRVYGVLVDAPDKVDPARQESAEVVRRPVAGGSPSRSWCRRKTHPSANAVSWTSRSCYGSWMAELSEREAGCPTIETRLSPHAPGQWMSGSGPRRSAARQAHRLT